MFLCQHVKFVTRIGVILLILGITVLYLMSSYKEHHEPNNITKTSYVHFNIIGKINDYKDFIKKSVSSSKSYRTKLIRYPQSNFSHGVLTEKSNVLNVTRTPVIRYGKGISLMKLAVVLCGERLNQTVVTLKSAVALTNSPLHLVIIADDDNRNKISDTILDWPESVLSRLSFEIHPITFPVEGTGEEWKKLFKLCACQRLFLPTLLQHIDALLYVDTDVLFLRPIEDIWQYFYKMNNSHISGLAQEHEDFATGWYNRFARHPYYEPLGVNSGVMLMNLTRMRSFQWQSYLHPIYQEYKLKIVWGDQDIINIIFHHHAEKLLIFPCEWNYRPDHCTYSSVCKTAETNGVGIIHGSRSVFLNKKQPAFKAVYDAMADYDLGTDLKVKLLDVMKEALSMTTNTNCGKLHKIITKALEESILRKTSAIR